MALACVLGAAPAGTPKRVLGAADAMRPALPVSVEVPGAGRADLLAAGRLRTRMRMRHSGRVRVRPLLLLDSGGSRPLGPVRRARLRGGRRRTVDLPLDATGRAALADCPAGRVAARVTGPRRSRPRTASGPLLLDAPDCARFFGPSAVWNQPLAADAPLDPDSQGVTGDLRQKVDAGYRSGTPPTINTEASAPSVYTVPAGQPRVPVELDDPGSDPALAEAFAAVPLPPHARPAPGSDSELVVWQPATDTLWEFWRLSRENGRWHAAWGGRLDAVSSGSGFFGSPHSDWGTTASSLPLAGGMITPRELARGEIDHALSLAVPHTRAGQFSLPAQRTDGDSKCTRAVPEGARFRLDPALNIDSLGLPPAVATIARAAQRYGIYVRDKADSVAFYAQSSVSLPSDPYPALFGGQPPYDLLRSFPWSHLQLVRMDLRSEPGYSPPLTGGLLDGC